MPVVLAFSTLIVALPLYVWSMTSLSSPQLPQVQLGEPRPVFDEGSLLFVGDIMLSRHVEQLSNEYGSLYSFSSVRTEVGSVDVAVGNLEGTAPHEHVPTPNFTFRFSIPRTLIEATAESGFDVVSLANNHAFDYGASGYVHTKELCVEFGLRCVGDPNDVATTSIAIVAVGDTLVGILALNATSQSIEAETVLPILASLTTHTALQFAYIHWGDEYVLTHNDAQAELAHMLIDSGVDAIVGHHPHVVQDIELYREKPIFYSLGNFIFDQYFSDDVQVGLTVRVDITEDELRYTLLPVSSVSTRSQPRFMQGGEGDALIARVISNHPEVFIVASSTAVLAFPRNALE